MPEEPAYHSPDVARALRPRSLLAVALSLQCKATVLVVLLTLSLVAVASGYLLQSGEEFAHSEHNAHMIRLASVLAKRAAPTVASGDLAALSQLVQESANDDPFMYVIFTDVQGRSLAVAESDGASILSTVSNLPAQDTVVPGRPVCRADHDGVPLYHDLTYPIVAGPALQELSHETGPVPPAQLVGYVRVGTEAHIWQESMAKRLDLMIGVAVLATVFAIPLGFLVVRRIVAPLDDLADAMHRFSHGELDVRSRITRRDEIGRLSQAFNAMADQQQRTHKRIVGLNAILEKRVAQRTRQLRELAAREPLTGLYNRRYFNEVLQRSLAEATRYQHDLSCVMIDLDGFKAVNDAYGHQVGDDLLVVTAATISSQLREADIAARFGGDEFILIMPQTDADCARTVVERITTQFRADAEQRSPRVRVTMSVGVASAPAPGIREAEDLIRAADAAMYAAKSAGKNCIVVTAAVSRPATL